MCWEDRVCDGGVGKAEGFGWDLAFAEGQKRQQVTAGKLVEE